MNSLSALAINSIWFSKQISLNDPFEGIYNLKMPNTEIEWKEEAIRYAKRCLVEEQKIREDQAENVVFESYSSNPEALIAKTKEAVFGLHAMLDKNKNDIAIFSTSSDYPEAPPQISNILLWSHYGAGFEGFCLKFDKDKLYKSLKELNKDIDFGITAVDYVESAKEFDFFGLTSTLDLYKAVQSKHVNWQYECEVRLIATKSGLMKFASDAVEVVYVGYKMPNAQEHLLLSVIEKKYPNAKIKKVIADRNEYGVRVGNKI